MGYTSRTGRRPNEYASKSAHAHVIKDAAVQEFLKKCDLPKKASDIKLASHTMFSLMPLETNPTTHVIAIDGGFTEVVVQAEFPSSRICFFQFGALIFETADLDQLSVSAFIDPADMEKLKRIQRIKLTLPIKNISMKGATTLTESIRNVLHTFFKQQMDDGELLETLRWFIFQEYQTSVDEWILASCPHPSCNAPQVPLQRKEMTADGRFKCPHCSKVIYLTDVFRLHEAIDDELGAGGILGYVTTTMEQMVLVHVIRLVLKTKPSLLKELIFIKDGPLAFFGQTANMHKPMRELVRYLFSAHDLHLAGLEKSGPFVEHAHEINTLLKAGDVLILDNDYIYKYVIPGKADPSNFYGRTTYYGNKIIFKSRFDKLHVLTLPTADVLSHPKASNFKNLQSVLANIEKLKCDMYDDSLVPVALANKLVSLANHPSSRLLQKFAIKTISGVP